MQIQPYLFFEGRCEEAMAFYEAALGARVEMMMRFKDSPEPPPPGMLPPGSDDKIMHACLDVGGAKLLASDGGCAQHQSFQGVSISLTMADKAAAEKAFAALSDGGKVNMPMKPTFFAATFGSVTDRFGVSWMVMAAPAGAPTGAPS